MTRHQGPPRDPGEPELPPLESDDEGWSRLQERRAAPTQPPATTTAAANHPSDDDAIVDDFEGDDWGAPATSAGGADHDSDHDGADRDNRDDLPPPLATAPAAKAAPPRAGGQAAPAPAAAAERTTRPRAWLRLALPIALVATAVALLFWQGQRNSQRLRLACEGGKVAALRGRGFPPWGFSNLPGAARRPIPLREGAACQARAFATVAALEAAHFELLLQTIRERLASPGSFADVELGAALLAQARQAEPHASAPTTADELDRLTADVAYLTAARDALSISATLDELATRFTEIDALTPMHYGDSADFARRVHLAARILRGEANADEGAQTLPREVKASAVQTVPSGILPGALRVSAPADAGVPAVRAESARTDAQVTSRAAGDAPAVRPDDASADASGHAPTDAATAPPPPPAPDSVAPRQPAPPEAVPDHPDAGAPRGGVLL